MDDETQYTEEQIQAFLIRWVMELGMGDLTYYGAYNCRWYGESTDETAPDFRYAQVARFFTVSGSPRQNNLRAHINQTGLEFIANYERKTS